MDGNMAIADKRTALIFCFHICGGWFGGRFLTLLGWGRDHVHTTTFLLNGGQRLIWYSLSFSLGCFGGKGVIPYFWLVFLGAAFLGTYWREEDLLFFLAVDDMLNFSSLWFLCIYTSEKASVWYFAQHLILFHSSMFFMSSYVHCL